jgi:heparin binding hemagglutinin HbhA
MSTRTMQFQDAVESFRVLAEDAANLAQRGIADEDWMVAANAESALALRELAAGAVDELQHVQRIDDLTAPLLAAVGAADLALARVNEITNTLRERVGETRADTAARIADSRARIARLQEELPGPLGELRDRLTSDELRRYIEAYTKAAQTTYDKLVERGEAALERLRDTPAVQKGRVGNAESQTRAVRERAAKLVGIELPKKASAKKAPAKKAQAKTPAKKAPAKKAAAKKVTRRT